LGTLGYAGVFSFSFLDRLTIFLVPAEVVLPAFGILISQGRFPFWPVMIWITIGSFLGNLALYYIFYKGGRPFLQQYGKYFLITSHELGHLDRWFQKYGEKFLVWGYFLPTSIRSLVPVLAGILRMNVRRFSVYTFFISMPLNFLYVYAGMKAGDNFDRILDWAERFNYIAIGLIVVLVAAYVYRHKTGRHLTHE